MARVANPTNDQSAPTTATTTSRNPYDLESLLKVVVEVFNDKGYDGTRMDDLSRALGITKGAIYHHVEGKEQLLKLALDQALDALDKIVGEAKTLDGRAIDQLEYLVRGAVRVLHEQHSFVGLLLRMRDTTPTAHDAIARRRNIEAYAADLVTKAQAAGDIRSDIDAALTSRLIFGMVNSLAQSYIPSAAAAADASVAETIIVIAFDGVRTSRKG